MSGDGVGTRHLIADEFLAIKQRQVEIAKDEAEQLAKAIAAQEERDKADIAKAAAASSVPAKPMFPVSFEDFTL